MTYPTVSHCPDCEGRGFIVNDYSQAIDDLPMYAKSGELPIVMFGDDLAPIVKQPWYISHAETIAQNVGGQAVAFVILWAYGITGSQGLALQLTFLVAAYIRGYTIRRWFESKKK